MLLRNGFVEEKLGARVYKRGFSRSVQKTTSTAMEELVLFFTAIVQTHFAHIGDLVGGGVQEVPSRRRRWWQRRRRRRDSGMSFVKASAALAATGTTESTERRLGRTGQSTPWLLAKDKKENQKTAKKRGIKRNAFLSFFFFLIFLASLPCRFRTRKQSQWWS